MRSSGAARSVVTSLGRLAARQHRLEEPGSGRNVAAFGDVDVDDLPVLVNGPVHVPPHSCDLDIGLIDQPPIARAVPARACRLDDEWRESSHPPVDRDVINLDVAFSAEFRDVAIRQPEPQVPAHRQQDHLAREPEPSERRGDRTTADHPGTLRATPDPPTQQCR